MRIGGNDGSVERFENVNIWGGDINRCVGISLGNRNDIYRCCSFRNFSLLCKLELTISHTANIKDTMTIFANFLSVNGDLPDII